MIPILMMICGALAALWGIGFTVYILISPVLVKVRSINGEGELVEDRRIRRKRIKDRQDLLHLSVTVALIGVLIFGAGYYIGYSARGSGIWFYDLVYGKQSDEAEWDRITKDGKYESLDGSTYSYYIVVSGYEYEFCGEKCNDIADVEAHLGNIRRENTVMLIDSYAAASSFDDAVELLERLGIKYETEEI